MAQVDGSSIERDGPTTIFFFNKKEIEAMDADDILARQVEQLDKEKRELQTRLKTQEKKVKYTYPPYTALQCTTCFSPTPSPENKNSDIMLTGENLYQCFCNIRIAI